MGGINGGLVLMRPSREEFEEMLRHLQTYSGCGLGADQDFLTDCWKNKGGLPGLPRAPAAGRMGAVGPSSRQRGWKRSGHRAGSAEAMQPSSR